ncbi:MAG: hypothetical protein ACHQ1G_08385, partial [Planctomycetota bacterium]
AYLELRCPTTQEMDKLAMARIFTDPRMKALIERAGGEDSFSAMRIPLADAMLSIRGDMLSVDNILVDVSLVEGSKERSFRVRDRVAIAITDIRQAEMPVEVVVAFETDGDAGEAAAVIERVAAAASLAARGGEGTIDEELARLVHHADHKGLPYAWADVGPVRLCLAPVGKLVVVATSEERIRDVLERSKGEAAECLARDPRHVAMLASVPGDGTPTTQIAIHVDHALRKFQAAFPQYGMLAQQGLMQVGLRDLEYITTVARVAGEGARASTSVRLAPAERRFALGRLFAKGGPPPAYGGLAFAPEDSLYVTCGNVDVPGLYDMIRELGGMQFAMAVAVPIERDFGLKLKEDLVDLLGPEITFIVAPNRGLLPDVALVCESSDAARLEKNLLQALSRVKWPPGTGVRDFKLRDVTVHAMPLGHPRLGNVPLAPTFGVVDGHLMIAPFPISFQRVLAVKRGDKPSIEKNREFAKLRAVVPPEAQGLSYLDLVTLFNLMYETGVPFLQAMGGGASPPPLYEFPEVDTLSRHLFGRVAWRITDERGLRWESYSSMDTSSFTLLLVAAASAGFLTFEAEPQPPAPPPTAERAREDDAQVCRHHVRMLRARVQHYRKENGRLPEKLEDLEATWMEPETFVVPGTDGKRYVYLGPKGQGDVLLHGYPNGADGLVTVLKTNLKFERVSVRDLEQMKGPQGGR